jgi:Raf kinase inhibitor-like YbhB/YbcL family protein
MRIALLLAMRRASCALLLLAAPAIASAGPSAPAPLKVTSAAFVANGAIPDDFACGGSGGSPPLAWSGVPGDAKSVVILVDEPETERGAFTHWLITGIEPSLTAVVAGDPPPDGAVSASNDDGGAGYTGPCPSSGRHRYFFRVFALDTTLDAAATETREAFLAAARGHIVAQGELVGTYARR